ncbi:MAG: hypothetical protein LLG44_05500 [Chloroflexi bacterium]|nr:hypothetical protein [Chloroflexota bacterium]
MKPQNKHTLHVVLWSLLGFAGFIVIAIVIPLWIRSQRTSSQPGQALDAAEIERNATKLAVQATAEAFPTSEIGIQGIKPLSAGELTVTPEATAYAPIQGSVQAGAGAIVEVQPPFPSSVYRITNAWYYDSEQGTERTFVWAGSYTRQGEVEPGIVVIQIYKRSEMNQAAETTVYDAPQGVGALTVTGAEGMRLTLQSEEGQTLYFDLAGRQFMQP